MSTTPRLFYYTRQDDYAELIPGYHYERIPCASGDCFAWVRTPLGMALTCTTTFDIEPLRPVILATVNELGSLDVVKEIKGLKLDLPPKGYLLAPKPSVDFPFSEEAVAA